MKRLHLFEIHDQEWCPRAIRDAETDYLQFVIARTKPYAAIVPLLVTALRLSGTREVLDLCSGAGGPWLWLIPVLAKQGMTIAVCLTDKFPNPALCPSSGGAEQAIRYHPQPVDATNVPNELTGFRTLFSAFHHFRPDEARAVLAEAVRRREGIAIVEGTHRRILAIALMLLVPLMVLVTTPFIRPFRWSRLFWTYVVPVVPLVTLFDGVVSCLRTYSVQELTELTDTLGAKNYQWQIGEEKSTAGPIPVTYLIGLHVQPNT